MPIRETQTVSEENADKFDSAIGNPTTTTTTTSSNSKNNKARIKKLVELCLAMGGPRYRNFEVQPGQRHDDIDAFRPLLESYLKNDNDCDTNDGDDQNSSNNSNSVDDTASFYDYFGKDIGLDQWSLLRCASSVWVNAPRIMQLLLDKGANPLMNDSSGRHVLTEALATARHGYNGPYQVLIEHLNKSASLSPITYSPDRIVRQANLSDTTEAILKHLPGSWTEKTIQPSLVRAKFLNLVHNGFTLYKKYYPPEQIQSFFEPMHLMRLSDLRRHPYIPDFYHSGLPQQNDPSVTTVAAALGGGEEGKNDTGPGMEKNMADNDNDFVCGGRVSLQDIVSKYYANDTDTSSIKNNSNKVRIVFFSHRWLRPWKPHPDDEVGTKVSVMVDAGLAYCRRESIEQEDCYLWIDYTCINQPDDGCKFRSIQTLPFYVMMCDAFIALDNDDYMTRAWCSLEALFGASMTVRNMRFGFLLHTMPKQQQQRSSSSSSRSSSKKKKASSSPSPPSSSTSSSSLTRLDPVVCTCLEPKEGGVSNAKDLPYICALSWFAAEIHLWNLQNQKTTSVAGEILSSVRQQQLQHRDTSSSAAAGTPNDNKNTIDSDRRMRLAFEESFRIDENSSSTIDVLQDCSFHTERMPSLQDCVIWDDVDDDYDDEDNDT